jgi:hypothetical protein
VLAASCFVAILLVGGNICRDLAFDRRLVRQRLSRPVRVQLPFMSHEHAGACRLGDHLQIVSICIY